MCSLLESPQQEEDIDMSATTGQEKEKMDTKKGHKLDQERTDHACDVSHQVPSQDAKIDEDKMEMTNNDKNLPVARTQHQTDADCDFWTSIITNGSILQALLTFLDHKCFQRPGRFNT